MTTDLKSALRKRLRRARRALAPAEHATKSALAASALRKSPRFACGRRVAVYLPFDGETDTAPLIAAARRRGVRLYAPVVVDRRHARIRFHPLAGAVRRGAFGIAAPARTSPPVPPRWFDLVVVPLVGVDAQGRRLGMGGGFYDRAFAFRRLHRRWRGPELVGYCFDCQRVGQRFADHWDLALDALATESGFAPFTNTEPAAGRAE